MSEQGKLYVGNLSWDTDESTLSAAFAACGNVSEVKVIRDRDTGRSRGFAFVTMADAQSATRAVQELNDSVVDGRTIRVNIAEDRGNARSGGQRREKQSRW